MSDRSSVAKIIGEYLREASVLVLVFGILEKYLHDEPPTFVWFGGILSVSGLALTAGIVFERKRRI